MLKKANAKKGFSILEVLISLTLIASVLTTGLAFVKRKDTRLKNSLRSFITLNRQLDHSARLKRQTQRLVISIDHKKGSTFWVEKKLPSHQQIQVQKNQSLPPDGFVLDKDFFDKPQKLPRHLEFESLETTARNTPITKGKAYVHYFPEGGFNLSVLKIKRGKTRYSLLIDRLRGELSIHTGGKDLKDFQQ